MCSLWFDKKKRFWFFVKSQFAPFCSGIYLAGQLTLLQSGRVDYPHQGKNAVLGSYPIWRPCPPITTGTPNFFTFRHLCVPAAEATEKAFCCFPNTNTYIHWNYINRALNCIRNFPHPEQHGPNRPIGTMKFRLRRLLKSQEIIRLFSSQILCY